MEEEAVAELPGDEVCEESLEVVDVSILTDDGINSTGSAGSESLESSSGAEDDDDDEETASSIRNRDLLVQIACSLLEGRASDSSESSSDGDDDEEDEFNVRRISEAIDEAARRYGSVVLADLEAFQRNQRKLKLADRERKKQLWMRYHLLRQLEDGIDIQEYFASLDLEQQKSLVEKSRSLMAGDFPSPDTSLDTSRDETMDEGESSKCRVFSKSLMAGGFQGGFSPESLKVAKEELKEKISKLQVDSKRQASSRSLMSGEFPACPDSSSSPETSPDISEREAEAVEVAECQFQTDYRSSDLSRMKGASDKEGGDPLCFATFDPMAPKVDRNRTSQDQVADGDTSYSSAKMFEEDHVMSRQTPIRNVKSDDKQQDLMNVSEETPGLASELSRKLTEEEDNASEARALMTTTMTDVGDGINLILPDEDVSSLDSAAKSTSHVDAQVETVRDDDSAEDLLPLQNSAVTGERREKCRQGVQVDADDTSSIAEDDDANSLSSEESSDDSNAAVEYAEVAEQPSPLIDASKSGDTPAADISSLSKDKDEARDDNIVVEPQLASADKGMDSTSSLDDDDNLPSDASDGSFLQLSFKQDEAGAAVCAPVVMTQTLDEEKSNSIITSPKDGTTSADPCLATIQDVEAGLTATELNETHDPDLLDVPLGGGNDSNSVDKHTQSLVEGNSNDEKVLVETVELDDEGNSLSIEGDDTECAEADPLNVEARVSIDVDTTNGTWLGSFSNCTPQPQVDPSNVKEHENTNGPAQELGEDSILQDGGANEEVAAKESMDMDDDLSDFEDSSDETATSSEPINPATNGAWLGSFSNSMPQVGPDEELNANIGRPDVGFHNVSEIEDVTDSSDTMHDATVFFPSDEKIEPFAGHADEFSSEIVGPAMRESSFRPLPLVAEEDSPSTEMQAGPSANDEKSPAVGSTEQPVFHSAAERVEDLTANEDDVAPELHTPTEQEDPCAATVDLSTVMKNDEPQVEITLVSLGAETSKERLGVNEVDLLGLVLDPTNEPIVANEDVKLGAVVEKDMKENKEYSRASPRCTQTSTALIQSDQASCPSTPKQSTVALRDAVDRSKDSTPERASDVHVKLSVRWTPKSFDEEDEGREDVEASETEQKTTTDEVKKAGPIEASKPENTAEVVAKPTDTIVRKIVDDPIMETKDISVVVPPTEASDSKVDGPIKETAGVVHLEPIITDEKRGPIVEVASQEIVETKSAAPVHVVCSWRFHCGMWSDIMTDSDETEETPTILEDKTVPASNGKQPTLEPNTDNHNTLTSESTPQDALDRALLLDEDHKSSTASDNDETSKPSDEGMCDNTKVARVTKQFTQQLFQCPPPPKPDVVILPSLASTDSEGSSSSSEEEEEEDNKFAALGDDVKGVRVDYKNNKYRGFVVVLHEQHGVMVLHSSSGVNRGEDAASQHWQLPGGQIHECEFIEAARYTNDKRMQLELASKACAARELFDQTGLDFRFKLGRLVPASLPHQPSKGRKNAINEMKHRYFFVLRLQDDDFLSEGDHPTGNVNNNLKIKLSAKHSEFTFQKEPTEASNMVKLQSAGKCSEALPLVMDDMPKEEETVLVNDAIELSDRNDCSVMAEISDFLAKACFCI